MTLIELMVVVAIVGVLMTTAVATVDTEPSAEDVAHLLANKVNEGVRQAIAGGPVDPLFILATGMDGRVQIQITTDAVGNQFLLVGRLVEDDYAFHDTGQIFVPQGIEIVGFRYEAKTDPGSSPNKTLGPFDVLAFYARADGSLYTMDIFTGIRYDSVTLYLRSKNNENDLARVVVLPLGGVPLVLSGW